MSLVSCIVEIGRQVDEVVGMNRAEKSRCFG